MIAIELGNGKTVMVKLEDWLNMTDEQFQDLIARNDGYDIDNPFDKVIDKIRETSSWEDTAPEEILPKLPDELPEDLVKKISRDGQ